MGQGHLGGGSWDGLLPRGGGEGPWHGLSPEPMALTSCSSPHFGTSQKAREEGRSLSPGEEDGLSVAWIVNIRPLGPRELCGEH